MEIVRPNIPSTVPEAALRAANELGLLLQHDPVFLALLGLHGEALEAVDAFGEALAHILDHEETYLDGPLGGAGEPDLAVDRGLIEAEARAFLDVEHQSAGNMKIVSEGHIDVSDLAIRLVNPYRALELLEGFLSQVVCFGVLAAHHVEEDIGRAHV